MRGLPTLLWYSLMLVFKPFGHDDLLRVCVRDGNILAILGGDETAVAAVAPNHVVWDGVDAIQPFQEEARWLNTEGQRKICQKFAGVF